MQKVIRVWAAVSFSLLMSGCANLSTRGTPPPIGIDGVPCVGQIGQPIPDTDAQEVSDERAVNEAQAASGKGGICAGKAFMAKRELRVYRVWDGSRSSSEFGRWWALDRPVGPRATYRQEFAICTAWSALDRLVSCDVKRGSALVIGTTQSVDCDEGPYPKSALHQVYLRNDLAADKLLLENCRDEGMWP